ncbi:MAG: leucine-rich repeat domain-containing protein, partial [Clostridia bacterium]|nr:leucine-rich repeat domain-containing protein [Clostridia bacterium]
YKDSINWEDGVLYIGNYVIKADTSISGDYTIKDGTLAIANYAFYKCTSLTSVTMPDSVTSIGDYAFYYCRSLTRINSDTDGKFNIPDSVTSIGSDAFNSCSSLKNVTIGNSVTSIGSFAFDDCTSLTSVTIGNSVSSIENYAFDHCTSLKSITISDSVTSIGWLAFCVCSSLESVYYTGTAEEWNSIIIESGNDYLTSATIYYYSETQPSGSGNYWHYVDGEIVIWEVIIHTEHTYEGYSYDDDNHWQVCSVCEEQTEAEAHTYGSDNICAICGLKKSSTGLKYVLSSDGTYYSVRGIGDCTDTDVVIPLTYNGLPVTEILAFAFMNNTTLTSITLSDNITSVSSGVIRGCTSLINIYVSEGNTSYKSIDGNLYSYDGTYLMQYAIGKTDTSFVIPEHVTYIYTYAFYGCANIVSVIISDNVRTIGNNAFSNCTSLKYITLSNNLISTGTTAFSYCTALESIVIPDSVISINGNAFERCESLKNIIIGSSVSTISSNAFDGCISLTSITLPESVESIGKQAFQNCTLLESISIGSNVTYIGYSVFEGTAFYDNESNWDNGVLYLGNYLIAAKTSISGEYTIKDGTTTIAYSAFADCTLLESITIPDSVVNIGNGAFDNTAYYNNENNWEDGVLYIGSCLIEANTSIYGNYTIKDGTTVIADNAFYNCTSLSVINIPNSVTAIGEYAFYYCIADIVWGDNPEITELGRYSFAYYQGYFLTIPDSVTVIKDHALWYCTSIENLIIPDSVTFIGDSGIYSCTSLKNIILSGNLTAVSGRAFYNSASLTSIIIPDGVTSIGDYSFTSCTSLTAIVIPDSVVLIDYHAFYNCSSLESVYYTGTAEEWEAVTIGAHNEPLETATIYYYSETQPLVSGNYWHYNSSGEVEVWNV